MQLATSRYALGLLAGAQNNLINGKLIETHPANVATFAIKTLANNDPSVLDPVMVMLPDASILTITAALSLAIPVATTIGTNSNVANRLWFAIVNDAGTPRIAVMRATVGVAGNGQIIKFDPRGVLSASILANSPCVVYSSVAITAKPYRVIAFADYDSGVPTAGTWTVSPTRITMVGPNTPMPGDVIQRAAVSISGQTAINTNANNPTAIQGNITPTHLMSAVQVRITADMFLSCGAAAENAYIVVLRNGAVQIGIQSRVYGWAATVVFGCIGSAHSILDFPVSTASVNYRLYAGITINGSNTLYIPWYSGDVELEEIMA